MSWQNPQNEKLQYILEHAKTVAVVGLSNNPERTSYQIAKAMQHAGYRIIPVNPMIDEVLGEKSYASLTNIDEKIDIINVFRRSEFVLDVAKEAITTDCNVFWMQQGVINVEAYHLLQRHNFTVVMDSCIKVVHAVLVK
ncbi:CoA-binding protein [Virgibacillus soli]|uniref:CoA-binding protein n=1 Tax=Paracerasibacillus soli TaxID=480284 RepID=A0ABU5CR14_9BACI|nr:CoA-binding protein [Virgibacillus soli]MDY0408239.1 CoA-binding protein [Virgibacillus soli]